jgi:hypothetical protein
MEAYGRVDVKFYTADEDEWLVSSTTEKPPIPQHRRAGIALG